MTGLEILPVWKIDGLTQGQAIFCDLKNKNFIQKQIFTSKQNE